KRRRETSGCNCSGIWRSSRGWLGGGRSPAARRGASLAAVALSVAAPPSAAAASTTAVPGRRLAAFGRGTESLLLTQGRLRGGDAMVLAGDGAGVEVELLAVVAGLWPHLNGLV